jgi:hypothetical protein
MAFFRGFFIVFLAHLAGSYHPFSGTSVAAAALPNNSEILPRSGTEGCMPQNLKELLAELQPLVQQIGDANGAAEGQPTDGEISTPEPEPAPASNDSPDVPFENIQAGGLTIGLDVDKNSPTKLQGVEVTPEPDGSFRIVVSAKTEQHR